MSQKKNVVIGLAGARLTQDEIALIKEHQPSGFILFARNCKSAMQVQELTASLKSYTYNPLILIDQEGGRINRLSEFNSASKWQAQQFGKLAQHNLKSAKEAVYWNYQVIASDLYELGINVNCAPVLDLQIEGAHQVIGNRSFGHDPQIVAELAATAAEAHINGGVLPVIKHIPGHGRAGADSHHELPVVDTDLSILESTDFIPFSKLARLPFAMTAHVTYNSLDPNNPVTTSSVAIRYIKEKIGYNGWLISDDLGMQALHGSMQERAHAAISAGCDLILHCSGNYEEIRAVVEMAELLSPLKAQQLDEMMRMVSVSRPLTSEQRFELLQKLENRMSALV